MRNDAFIQSLDWSNLDTELLSSERISFMDMTNKEVDPFTCSYEDLHPILFASKLNILDNSNYYQAVNEPNDDGYLEATDLDYNILYDKMNVWTIISLT